MYKKLFLAMMLLCAGASALGVQKYNTTFQGFQNLEKKQQIIAINNLQAIADNDSVKFSYQWPSEYFSNNGVYSFIYLAKNDVDSLDLIKFDIDSTYNNECSLAEKNPEFCIPKITPNLITYVYNERLIVHYTPDFIEYPDEKAVFEVVMRDNVYLGNKLISSTIVPKEKELKHDCNFAAVGKVKACRAIDPETNSVIYTQQLVLRDSAKPATLDNILKYVKYDTIGKKMEEYIYSNGKHIFYDDNGQITQFYQVNAEKFRYYNKKLPDLYIDIDFIRDVNDRVVEERYKDRNGKVVRKYVADYQHGEIKNIHVFDIFNQLDWYVEPVAKLEMLSTPSFSIRY